MKVIQLHKNERELIQKLKLNENEAQHELYSLYAPKMLSVCRQYISDLQYAEEMMLNGFLKVFTKINQYESKGNFEGWIRRIMINESISFLRLKKRMVFVDDDAFFEDKVFIETNLDNETSMLQSLVDNLREDLRVVFNLYVVEEYKHKEIASVLNISENASKLRYRRAKEVFDLICNLRI